ncbi:hypothetical protein GDO78_007732 [Eleutherodactylus coqui]|uniref:DH domain-containing protein n=1 Tax=Eleutherodactylus coqui TaxID=57060 RepID=A0A8J6FHP1_ELECQ|nr:hypothetical protein GDO78_007732 [Eleutherodactylus coqui]
MMVFAQFGEDFHLPEDAEFYFVYNGSSHRHVSFAERLSANSLRSVFPGHNCPESLSVAVCMHTHGYSPVIVASTSISYVRDRACSISHSLKSHCDGLTSSSHQSILEQFDVSLQDLQLLDRNMMLCLAHEDLTPSWNILGSYAQSDSLCHETLLHLTMRWGLTELSHYLMCLPGGTSALSRVNKEGETPVEVAIRHGHEELVQLLKNLQELPPLDFYTAAINQDSYLRFCWSSGVLALTRRQTSAHSLESDIELFRKCLCDTNFFDKIVSPMHSWNYKKQRSLDGSTTGGEKRHSSVDVLKRIRYPPTMLAATRLSAMLNGNDEVYANSMVVDEVNDSEANFIHLNAGLDVSYNNQSGSPRTSESSLRDTSLSTYASPEVESGDSPTYNLPSRHSLLEGPHRLCRTLGYGTDRDAAFSSVKKRSSSLDGLDADSEGEGTYSRYQSSDSPAKEDSSSFLGNSADELDLSETIAERDFQNRQVGTLPLLQSKDPLSSGLRFRSYSYSSPKNFLGKTRLTRDPSIGEPGDDGVFYANGRSLLQSLSLSKSVSFLHPGKRAYSLPEQSREKRIEEEDWDRYMAPAKPECEKNKVSRTFSFLRSRMSSTRNKNKTKNKETKEKVNRHQFVTGTFSGVVPCLVCEKALLGKESLQCSSKYKFQDRYNPKYKQPAVISNSSFKDIPQPVISASPPSTSMSIGKRDSGQAPNAPCRGVPVSGIDSLLLYRRSDQSLESDGDTSGSRSRSQSEELLQSMGTSPSMDAFPIEDVVDSALWTDFSSDVLEFEAESWSSVVESSFCHKQEKNVIKRQDVIFELMQTELHHIQTLCVMSEIFRKGMKEELQLDHSTVDKIFPCLDELLESHKSFFYSLRERKQESREGNDRNFVIHRIGDILVQQVTNSNLQARRRGIPECILLVTQRITKYPVLVERILRYTPEGTEEHKDLCRSLGLIKDMVAAVDLRVSEFERKQKLEDFLNKIENKTFTKMKNGNVFTKQDLRIKERVLLHDGVLLWKTATGRFKDIQALLLSDVLLFLQEKDQKYIFAAVGKPCESDEDKRAAEARVAKAKKYQEILGCQDQQIFSCLEDKLHIFAELAGMCGGSDLHLEPHLLVKADSGEVPQAASLLAAALKEGYKQAEAIVTLQDTQIELNKALLQDHEQGSKGLALRGALLQEHSRHLDRHRGEMTNLEKLQHHLQQEKQRWERECQQKDREYEEMENLLQERQRACQYQEHILEEEREELGHKLQEYQQDVERLNEGHRMVESKRQQLCLKHKLLSHTRQNSMPVLIPRTKSQGVRNSQHDSLQNEDSNYINALAQMSLSSITALPDSHPHVDNTLDLAETSENSPVDISSQPWSSLISRQQRLENSSRHINKDTCNNDINAAHVIYCGTLLTSAGHNTSTGTLQSQTSKTVNALHADPPACVENGLVEETIVYL